MYNSNEFVRRIFYSLELKHQICKEHIENGLSLLDCVEKYNLSCHSMVHDWLRKPGYIAGLAKGYLRMIELAESELKIQIRKKPGTK